jgi:hypothetical protein
MGRKNTNHFPPINRWLYHIRRGVAKKIMKLKKTPTPFLSQKTIITLSFLFTIPAVIHMEKDIDPHLHLNLTATILMHSKPTFSTLIVPSHTKFTASLSLIPLLFFAYK